MKAKRRIWLWLWQTELILCVKRCQWTCFVLYSVGFMLLIHLVFFVLCLFFALSLCCLSGLSILDCSSVYSNDYLSRVKWHIMDKGDMSVLLEQLTTLLIRLLWTNVLYIIRARYVVFSKYDPWIYLFNLYNTISGYHFSFEGLCPTAEKQCVISTTRNCLRDSI